MKALPPLPSNEPAMITWDKMMIDHHLRALAKSPYFVSTISTTKIIFLI